jgi:hypothetical protein
VRLRKCRSIAGQEAIKTLQGLGEASGALIFDVKEKTEKRKKKRAIAASRSKPLYKKAVA